MDKLLNSFSYKVIFLKPIVGVTTPAGLNVAPPIIEFLMLSITTIPIIGN